MNFNNSKKFLKRIVARFQEYSGPSLYIYREKEIEREGVRESARKDYAQTVIK